MPQTDKKSIWKAVRKRAILLTRCLIPLPSDQYILLPLMVRSQENVPAAKRKKDAPLRLYSVLPARSAFAKLSTISLHAAAAAVFLCGKKCGKVCMKSSGGCSRSRFCSDAFTSSRFCIRKSGRSTFPSQNSSLLSPTIYPTAPMNHAPACAGLFC
jgi:hypothetical protein